MKYFLRIFYCVFHQCFFGNFHVLCELLCNIDNISGRVRPVKPWNILGRQIWLLI